MPELFYQNPSQQDAKLDSVQADPTTTPETRREIVVLGDRTQGSREDVFASLRAASQLQNIRLLQVLRALNQICIALEVDAIDENDFTDQAGSPNF